MGGDVVWTSGQGAGLEIRRSPWDHWYMVALSSTHAVKSQPVCLLPVGILVIVIFIHGFPSLFDTYYIIHKMYILWLTSSNLLVRPRPSRSVSYVCWVCCRFTLLRGFVSVIRFFSLLKNQHVFYSNSTGLEPLSTRKLATAGEVPSQNTVFLRCYLQD